MPTQLSALQSMVLASAFGIIFVGIYIRIGFGILLPEMINTLGMTKTEAGLVSAAYFVLYTMFSPLLGTLSDKVGGRFVIALFCGVMGAGAALESLAYTPLTALMFYGIVGVGSGALWAPVLSVTQRWFGRKRRGIITGIVDSGSSLAWILTGLTLPVVVTLYDWRGGWLVMGAMAVSMAVISAIFLRDKPVNTLVDEDLNASESKTKLRGYSDIFNKRFFWLAGFAYLTVGFAVSIPTTFTVTYASLEMGLPYVISASLVAAAGFARALTTLSFAAISDKAGRHLMIVFCHLLIFLGMFLLTSARSNVLAMMVSMILFGLGNGGVWPLYAALAADRFVREHTGFVIGVWTSLLGIGFILGPAIAGIVADHTGSFMYSFALSGIISLSGIILMQSARRYPVKVF